MTALIAWTFLPWNRASPKSPPPGPDTTAPRPSRYERLRAAAAVRGIPLPAILTFCGVVVVVYLTGKIAYRMLDILLMTAVSLFGYPLLSGVTHNAPKLQSVGASLAALGLPFPLLWALWVAIVDFLPMIGGASPASRPCCSPWPTR